MQPENTRKVAAIANKFIQHARYRLSPREQKLIIYMSSFIKPEDSDFDTYLVPVSDLESVFRDDDDKKHGSFYERLDDLLDSITDKKISFPTEFELEGRRMRGHINWVSGAVPRKDKRGVLCVEFGFSPQMKPFMLGLREKFTKIELLEVAQMTSGFSIRIFQICKSYYYEHAKYGRNVYKTGVDSLKEILGIDDKYPDFRNFRRKVLNVAQDEINSKTGLNIEYDFIRHGRRIGEIHIKITEKESRKEQEPTKGTPQVKANVPENREELREAQMRAIEKLVAYGLHESIAIGEVLPIITGSELIGYEDYFADKMLAFFSTKTNRKSKDGRAKALVGWLRNGRFTEANLFARLTEEVIAQKKNLGNTEHGNRQLAKTMNYQKFRELFKKNVPQFELENFKKEFSDAYSKITIEQQNQLTNLKDTVNYKKMLTYSIELECERWYNANKE